jgi:hypothetical protein
MTTGTSRAKRALASTVTAAVLALLATLFGPLATAQAQTYPCPGGPSSGASSSGSSCPTLHNRDIVAEAAMPDTLYRGDSRPPIADNDQGIFNTGFWSRGTNSDIVSHVQGDRSLNSEYISTTARYNRGFLVPSTITFQYDQFVANPHHAQTRITYDPATDRGADWTYDTALNSPTANGYSRGCSSITRCRNGS